MKTEHSKLLATGKIYLIRKPIDGRLGALKLWNLATSGSLGIDVDIISGEEVWIVMASNRASRLRIFHIDDQGYSLTTRINYDGRFDVLFSEDGPKTLTRSELQRLILDGTVEGDWHHPRLACRCI